MLGVGNPKVFSAAGTLVCGLRADNSAGVKVRLAGGGFFLALCANPGTALISSKKESTLFFIKKRICRFGCRVEKPALKVDFLVK
jgi:hypothetical protein